MSYPVSSTTTGDVPGAVALELLLRTHGTIGLQLLERIPSNARYEVGAVDRIALMDYVTLIVYAGN